VDPQRSAKIVADVLDKLAATPEKDKEIQELSREVSDLKMKIEHLTKKPSSDKRKRNK
jgi:uncharacterized protein YoxC